MNNLNMFSKRINLSLLLLILAIGTKAQKTKVQGAVEGLTDPIIFRYNAGTVEKADTVNVKDGTFTWKAKFSEPQKVIIQFPKGTALFYTDKGKIRITGNVDSLLQLSISGSSLQKEADAYFASLKDINDQIPDVSNKYKDEQKKDEQKILMEKLQRLLLQREERTIRYITAHPKSYLSVYLIEDRAGMANYLTLKPLYDLLDPTVVQSEAGKRLSKRLAVLKRSEPGETMLDFTQNSNEGKPVRFSDFKGKYVLVDFWASWCAPCRAENPNVLAAYNRYKDKNFTVLGISLDDKEDKWKKAIQEDKLPWTQVSDLKGKKNEVSTYYNIRGIPTAFLVDPDGKIIATSLRGKALHKKLAEVLDK